MITRAYTKRLHKIANKISVWSLMFGIQHFHDHFKLAKEIDSSTERKNEKDKDKKNTGLIDFPQEFHHFIFVKRLDTGLVSFRDTSTN